MCDFASILGYLAAGQGLIAAAVVALVVAIAANSSLFLAPTAAVPYAVALMSAAGAAAMLVIAGDNLANPACTANGACAAELAAARAALDFAAAAMAATLVLAAVAAATVAVPWVGAAAMVAYSVGLVTGGVAVSQVAPKLKALQLCRDAAANTLAVDVLTVTGFVVGFLAVGFGLIAGGSAGNDRRNGVGPFAPKGPIPD